MASGATARVSAAAAGRLAAEILPALLPIGVLLLLDHVPRFMVGDSQSYLSTGSYHSYPPDRSWVFGLCVHALMHLARGLHAYILLQAALLLAAVIATQRCFAAGVGGVVFALAAACDPLIEAYVRYYLSDLSAALLFVGFVCALSRVTGRPPAPGRLAAWLGLAGFGIGAVLFRLAYAPIELATVGLCMAAQWRRRDWPLLRGLAAAGLAPMLAVAVLTAANGVVFARRFPGAVFANRSSGVFLMGVFSPALTAADIRAAGIDVTDEEVAAMHLPVYDDRINQVWGGEPFWLRHVIERRLHATDPYDARVDAAGSAVVRAAWHRDPLAVAEVYLRSLWLYAAPSQWRAHIDSELGTHRPLDAWFVDYLRPRLDAPVSAASPETASLLPELLAGAIGFYPCLLLAGGGVAVLSLAGIGAPALRPAAAALLAGIAVVPLYSNYVIPRYLLSSVWFAWLLLSQAAIAPVARRAGR